MKRLRDWLRNPEIIGAPDCPLMLRWTLLDSKPPTVNRATEGQSQGRTLSLIELPKWLTRDRKLMVHHFLPNVEDRDPHDHPRGFWTFVLWGRYFDLVPCEACEGLGGERILTPIENDPGEFGRKFKLGEVCSECRGEGTRVGTMMTRGTLRYRKAQHIHITQSGPRGAWTLVLMTPLERKWGFWRNGKWWPWKDYEAEFGFAMRCPTEEEVGDTMMKYTDRGVVRKAAPVGVSSPVLGYVEEGEEPGWEVPPALAALEGRGGRESVPNAAPWGGSGSGRTSLTLDEAREQVRRLGGRIQNG